MSRALPCWPQWGGRRRATWAWATRPRFTTLTSTTSGCAARSGTGRWTPIRRRNPRERLTHRCKAAKFQHNKVQGDFFRGYDVMRHEGEPSVEEILASIKKVIARDNRDFAE